MRTTLTPIVPAPAYDREFLPGTLIFLDSRQHHATSCPLPLLHWARSVYHNGFPVEGSPDATAFAEAVLWAHERALQHVPRAASNWFHHELYMLPDGRVATRRNCVELRGSPEFPRCRFAQHPARDLPDNPSERVVRRYHKYLTKAHPLPG